MHLSEELDKSSVFSKRLNDTIHRFETPFFSLKVQKFVAEVGKLQAEVFPLWFEVGQRR